MAIIVKNIMEDVVESYLDECMEAEGMCMCEQCRADVKALALTKLPPRYVSRTQGDMMAGVSVARMQGRVDVISAITQSMVLVKDKPRH